MRPVLLLLAMGCSNAPIDDGARFGPFTQVKTFFTSSFVAETSDGVVLVDSGFSRNASPIAAHLEERGLGLEDVRHVVITKVPDRTAEPEQRRLVDELAAHLCDHIPVALVQWHPPAVMAGAPQRER